MPDKVLQEVAKLRMENEILFKLLSAERNEERLLRRLDEIANFFNEIQGLVASQTNDLAELRKAVEGRGLNVR